MNGSFTNNLGLFNGKMGIAIFMYKYARQIGNEIYEDYAGELIDEIFEEINTSTPVGFENGLTGVGWGIEYLVKNQFIEADTNEVLSEIDNVINKAMMQRSVLTVDDSDLFGYGLYYLSRLRENQKDNNNRNTQAKRQVLTYLIVECERLLILKRYLNFNISALSLGMINSIALFLAEIHKLGLSPSKTEKLLRHLPSELEFTVKVDTDQVKQYILYHLIQDDIIPIVSDSEIQKNYESYAKMMVSEWKEMKEEDDNIPVSFSSLAWHNLIYGPYVKGDNDLLLFNEKAFNVVDNEENWSKRLDRLSTENIGLNGIAGLGLGLLDGFGTKFNL
jgi:hypothetical protein